MTLELHKKEVKTLSMIHIIIFIIYYSYETRY